MTFWIWHFNPSGELKHGIRIKWRSPTSQPGPWLLFLLPDKAAQLSRDVPFQRGMANFSLSFCFLSSLILRCGKDFRKCFPYAALFFSHIWDCSQSLCRKAFDYSARLLKGSFLVFYFEDPQSEEKSNSVLNNHPGCSCQLKVLRAMVYKKPG